MEAGTSVRLVIQLLSGAYRYGDKYSRHAKPHSVLHSKKTAATVGRSACEGIANKHLPCVNADNFVKSQWAAA